jgi:lycopene beta-cyclase
MVPGYRMAGTLKSSQHCDILIAGAGLAGLSLLYRAIRAGVWKDLSIIVVDKCITNGRLNKNWSFWKRSAGPFDHLINKSWDKLSFFSQAGTRKGLVLNGYGYHTIKSSEFYTHCLAYLHNFKNIRFVDDEIITINGDNGQCCLESANFTFTSTYLFNSVYQKPVLQPGGQYFLQHFKGLLIESSQLEVDPEEAYLMDFRTSQEHGTSFFYTLPLSATKVFVEYTIFSKCLVGQAEYDGKLRTYLKEVLQITEYEVLEEEYGVIPMTDHAFPRFQGNIINLGSAGGDTRGATGYTFTNVQKTVNSILTCWSRSNSPFFKSESISLKHQIYDACLLNVLNSGKYNGHEIFEDLFMHTKAASIFAFLDAESTLLEDAAVITGLKPLPFAEAMMAVLARKLRSRLK